MNKLPRVCVVSPLYHPGLGGVGRQAVALTEKLHASGVRLFVLCRRIPGLPEWVPAPGIEVRELRTLGSRKHDLEEKTLGNMMISLSFCLNLLLALFRHRKEYDLVHFHGASLPLIFNVIPLKLMRKKIVAKVAGAKMKIEAGSFRGTYMFLGDIFIRILRRVDAFVAISSEIRDELRKDGFTPDTINEIPNFILPGQFYPLQEPADREGLKRRLGIDPTVRVLTFSGRLVKRKRVDVLLGAMAELLKCRSDVVLIILGKGEMKAELENMSRSLGIQDRVVFRDFVPNILDYLQVTDIFVFPSAKEGLPNALLEAMACGVPVVASRIGGVVDVVRDRENGLLVSPGDHQELAKAIVELLEDGALRRSLGERAAETVRSGHDIEIVALRYLDLYRKVARGSEYARYLRSRGRARLLLRRLFLMPVRRFFQGRVLDIGSGIGEFLEIYPDAVGVDRDMDNVAYCAGRGQRCLCADAYHLPFCNRSFDGVLLNNVLEHLEYPDAAMKEVTRVLRDGGRIMVELPGRKGYAFDPTHVRFWRETDIVSLLMLYGFLDIRTGYFPIPFERAGEVLTHNKLRVYAVFAPGRGSGWLKIRQEIRLNT